TRHPAPRDAERRLLVLQGDRHLLPARPLDRHCRRDPRSARPGHDAARQRRDEADVALGTDVHDDPRDRQPLLAARLLGGRRALPRHRQRRGGVQRGRGLALSEARRRDRSRDRADRRAAQPRRVVAGSARRAASRPRSLVTGWARDDAKLDRVRALMAESSLDALVVRAPDNVLYLTNFWGMKGYDGCAFPRGGEPTLIFA